MLITNKQPLTIEDISPFQWQLHLQDGEFICDERLLKFLGYSKNTKLNLDCLLKVFNAAQFTQLKKMVKQTLVSKKSNIGTFVTTALKSSYLIEFYFDFDHQQTSKLVIYGYIRLLKRFPNAAQIDELLRLVFADATNGMMLTDANHQILMVNQQYCIGIGYLEHELLGKHARMLKSGHYNDDFYSNLWSKVDTSKAWNGELLAKNKQGKICAFDVRLRRLDVISGDHYYYIDSVQLDMPKSLFDNNKFNPSSLHIPEKQAFTVQLKNCYNKLSSNKTIVVAAFTAKALQKVSTTMMQWLIAQRFNIAEQDGHLGLISESIFCAYWIQDKDADKINILLQNTLKILTADTTVHLSSNLNVNMGVSVLAVDALSHTQLLTHSMQTLIATPCSKESEIYYFDRRLTKRFNKRKCLAKLLKTALKDEKIEVYYQPIINLHSQRICKFEALFRVSLNTSLSYNTQELISIAEEYNWVDEIDRKVTKIALNALPLLQQHLKNVDIGMAINRSLANDRITKSCLEETMEILLKSEIDLSKVTIELTESAFFDDTEEQKFWLNKLQAHGVQIALDDFGTGYSSFSYLKDFIVNIVKIDRSFVTGLTLDSNEYTMIAMLCQLTHQLGGKVIAEGIESEEEFNLLSRAKVDEIQGYLVSKPKSLETILASPNLVGKEIFNLIYQEPIITVSYLMNRNFTGISLDARLLDAKQLLKAQEQKYLLVIHEAQCLGILSTADVFAALSPYLETEGEQKRDVLTLEKRVHQVMNKEFPKVNSNSPVTSLDSIFLHSPDAVVVVTTNEQSTSCIGVITIQDLLRYKFIKENK